MEFRGEHANLSYSEWRQARYHQGGDVVTIRGYHARDMTVNVGAAREIVMADGRSFAVGPAFGGSR
jgi:hypothetical protein